MDEHSTDRLLARIPSSWESTVDCPEDPLSAGRLRTDAEGLPALLDSRDGYERTTHRQQCEECGRASEVRERGDAVLKCVDVPRQLFHLAPFSVHRD